MLPLGQNISAEYNDFSGLILRCICVFGIGLLLFSECSVSPRYVRSSQKPVQKTIYGGNENSTDQTVASDKSGSTIGVASYYATKFDGRKTASGEIFNNNLLTAAHPTLPFGTNVKVTCLENNRSVIVRINDRGPFSSKKRIIDVSQSAARELGFFRKGLAKVCIEIVD